MAGTASSTLESYRIAAVSGMLGIPVPTIRSWERRYGFPVPPRTGGSHRRYSEAEVGQLRELRDLITRGYPAREAVGLVRAGTAMPSGSGELLDDVVGAALRLDPDGIRTALDRATETPGVESAIRDVLLPAMSMVGTSWKTGNCEIEHEHLATTTVRGWLARQAALAPRPFRPRPVVLACGPKDLHTIGIEAFAVILGRRGWACRVLGQMTPAEALAGAVRSTGAAAAVITAQRAVTRRAAVECIGSVAPIPGVEVFYAGDAFTSPAARAKVPGHFLGTDIVAAAQVMEDGLEAAAPGGVVHRVSRSTIGAG